MLKKNFNELDNDFITVWSKLLTAAKNYIHDILLKESIYPALMALANLGQIDALQGIMLFGSLSKYIDESELAHAVKKYDILNPGKRSLNKDKSPLVREKYLEAAAGRNINHQFSPFLGETLLRRKLRYLKAEKDNSPTERFAKGVDVISTMYYQLIDAALLRIKLRKLTEKENSPANQFAYAKNLFFFGSKKQREHGYYILKELANRDYCEKTKNEMEKTTQCIIEKDNELIAKGLKRELIQYDYGCIPQWL